MVAMRHRLLAVLVALLVLAGACSDDDDTASDTTPAPDTTGSVPSEPSAASIPPPTDEQRFPDVVAVDVTRSAGGPARFDVTISSPYDTPERYADAWRVVGADGTEYGVRELTHDHANEQPFTRSLEGVVIPDGVAVVTVEARDSTNGWGGATMDVDVSP
jgi:hypothetical protein